MTLHQNRRERLSGNDFFAVESFHKHIHSKFIRDAVLCKAEKCRHAGSEKAPMTRLLQLWLMLAVCFAASGLSASAAPYHNPGYGNLRSDHLLHVREHQRRYFFWRKWFGRKKNSDNRRHRDYEKPKQSNKKRDVNKKRRKNGSRFWGGPYWGYGARLSHPCERCRSNCEGGKRGPYCRRCRARCGW